MAMAVAVGSDDGGKPWILANLQPDANKIPPGRDPRVRPSWYQDYLGIRSQPINTPVVLVPETKAWEQQRMEGNGGPFRKVG